MTYITNKLTRQLFLDQASLRLLFLQMQRFHFCSEALSGFGLLHWMLQFLGTKLRDNWNTFSVSLAFVFFCIVVTSDPNSENPKVNLIEFLKRIVFDL